VQSAVLARTQVSNAQVVCGDLWDVTRRVGGWLPLWQEWIFQPLSRVSSFAGEIKRLGRERSPRTLWDAQCSESREAFFIACRLSFLVRGSWDRLR